MVGGGLKSMYMRAQCAQRYKEILGHPVACNGGRLLYQTLISD
jgi:hypothetical protein